MEITRNLNAKSLKLLLITLLLGVLVVINLYVINRVFSGSPEQVDQHERVDRNMMVYQ
ncbi:hypothetical protein ACFQ5N_03405 [Lutibacter holmesii]|uniref:Uncharacterized protein n=1 Tax=Lutibacter holmesii TaxID=1137985 RepID=A0ABW3WKC1_9FLAO